MLRRLSVENYALIEKLEMELDPHLNIITGETGAGKSILLGALGLLLGAKNDGSAMKDAARNCVVEGTFDLSGRGMKSFFDENDLDYAPETHVTRMITPAGKSRAFINDIPVQLAQLREFGTRLIDIHSQHQNLILSSEEFRTSALDTVAGNGGLLAQYTAQYARLSELRRQLAALREAAAEAGRPTNYEVRALIMILALPVLWILGTWIPVLNVTTVAIIGLAIMFIPGINLLTWEEFSASVPWTIILMVGAVLSLGNMFSATGADVFVTNLFMSSGVASLNFTLFLLITVVFIYLLHTIAPVGAAIISLFLPILIGICTTLGVSPAIPTMLLAFNQTGYEQYASAITLLIIVIVLRSS